MNFLLNLCQVTSKRIAAAQNDDKTTSNAWKLVGNSCYGRLGCVIFSTYFLIILGMNLTKHRNVKFRTDKTVQTLINSGFYERHEPFISEGGNTFYEVISRKKSITDKIPIATAFCILGNAKLTVLKFMNEFQQTINNDAIRLLYMGKSSVPFGNI